MAPSTHGIASMRDNTASCLAAQRQGNVPRSLRSRGNAKFLELHQHHPRDVVFVALLLELRATQDLRFRRSRTYVCHRTLVVGATWRYLMSLYRELPPRSSRRDIPW